MRCGFISSILFGFALAAPSAAFADSVKPESDRFGRMVMPVTINGQGPFRLIVDTGATSTTITPDLAKRLGIAPLKDRVAVLAGIQGEMRAPLVQLKSVAFGDVKRKDVRAALIAGDVLAGTDGILGMDGLDDHRIVLNFERNTISIAPSSGAPAKDGFVAIKGQMKFGYLLNIEANADGIPVRALVDTGAERTLANPALRDALLKHGSAGLTGFRVAGVIEHQTAAAESATIDAVMLGDLRIRNVHAFSGNLDVFKIWKLEKEPALVLGMDLWSMTRAIAIDFKRKEFQVLLTEQQIAASPPSEGPR
jgi:clan AA aspartic protease (TIGR02281 family)